MDCKKLKILCLHGFRQNKDTFRQKLGFLRKLLKAYAEFVFIDAPHTLENAIDSIDEITAGESSKSWWFTGPNQNYISKDPSDMDYGFYESLQYLKSVIKDNGPFDGLLGFSQGAAFAALISILIERKEFEADFKFVILVAGFKSLCKPHLSYYDTRVTLPSLHIIGDTDNVIGKERSEDLMDIFENPQLIRHSGGHYVPGGKEMKDKYMEFLKLFK